MGAQSHRGSVNRNSVWQQRSVKILPSQIPGCKVSKTIGFWKVTTARAPLAKMGIARGQALRTAR